MGEYNNIYRFGVFLRGESMPMPNGLYNLVGVLPKIRLVGVPSGVPEFILYLLLVDRRNFYKKDTNNNLSLKSINVQFP